MSDSDQQNRILTSFWQKNGGQTRQLSAGTPCFHGGTVSGIKGFHENKAAWFFIRRQDKHHCESYMRLRYDGMQTHLLECELSVSVELAIFRCVDTVKFAGEHCNADHNCYKQALFDWGGNQGLDGIFFDQEPPEVILFHPGPRTLRPK